jgi:glycosyltransferase involved in cell wall biosynthesis
MTASGPTLLDVLCFSSSDWHGKWGSRQQVMLRLAGRGHRVLYVEQQAGLEHLLRYPSLLRRRLRRWKEGLRRVKDSLWIASPPPLLPGRYYSPAASRLNQRLVARWTRRHLRELALTPTLLWLYRPEQAPLIGRFGERLSVYHCIDEFTAGTRGRKRATIAAMEADLLRRVDVVFANSLLTYEGKRQLNPYTYRIPSGADVDHFARALDPATATHPAIGSIPHPIAGYVGNLNEKLNVPLLFTVAGRLPDWQFVFVGRAYPQKINLHPLRALPNVHLLGRFPFEEIPSLVKGMDVCLLPYVEGEAARYRSPLKLYEYLAAGRPVVSTDHPEVREFAAWVEVASGPAGFASAIVRAQRGESVKRRERRAELSQAHSWDRRADDVERIIRVHLDRR